MGIYDREYYRDDGPRGFSLGELSIVTQIVFLNLGIFVVDWLFLQGRLRDYLRLFDDTLSQPTEWWRLFSHGVVHADLLHVAFNMFVLWQLGRDVAEAYGRGEFLAIYIIGILAGGLAWSGAHLLSDRPGSAVGASAGVTAILLVYGLRFRERELLFMGVVRMKALPLVAIFVAIDVIGALSSRAGEGAQRVAYEAHLGGALWGFLYFTSGLSITGLFRGNWSKLRRARPKLRVHAPDTDDRDSEARNINDRVDEILEKISRSGESSLTPAERETLVEASRRFQQKRR